jgi:diguanylate cyclase (GGDEF)-like protein
MPKPPVDEKDISIRIFHQSTKMFWIYFPGQLLVLGTMDLLFYPYIPVKWLLLWNLIHLLNFGYRFQLLRKYLSTLDRTSGRDTEKYLRRYFISLFVTGLLWAVIVGFLRFVPDDVYFLVYSLIIMMTFASTTSIGPVRRYFLAYTIPMNLVMFVDLVLQGGKIHYVAALSLLMSFYFCSRSSRIHFREYARILQEEARANLMRQYFEKLASTDLLTGLPNRYKFLESFEKALRQAEKSGRSCVLFFLDLDRFKTINDTLGHHIGDRVLETIGERLRSLLGERGVAARLAGDEFVILLREELAEDETGRLAEEIRRTLAAPMVIEGETVTITTSIGIVRYPDHGRTPQDLLRCADAAMYLSKKHGTPEWYGKG